MYPTLDLVCAGHTHFFLDGDFGHFKKVLKWTRLATPLDWIKRVIPAVWKKRKGRPTPK